MTDTVSPCYAWAIAAMALGHTLGLKPLPPGITHGQVGDWDVSVNNSKLLQRDIPAFGVEVRHRIYLAFGAFDPAGGCIGGMSEDDFIADMEAALPPELIAELRPND